MYLNTNCISSLEAILRPTKSTCGCKSQLPTATLMRFRRTESRNQSPAADRLLAKQFRVESLHIVGAYSHSPARAPAGRNQIAIKPGVMCQLFGHLLFDSGSRNTRCH
jgi:hypothetical protein